MYVMAMWLTSDPAANELLSTDPTGFAFGNAAGPAHRRMHVEVMGVEAGARAHWGDLGGFKRESPWTLTLSWPPYGRA